MFNHRLMLTLPALALLSACSSMPTWMGGTPPAPAVREITPPPPPPPAPAPGSLAPAGLDGRYIGSQRLAPGASRGCRPASMPVSATVNGGRVALSFGRYGEAEGVIGAAGDLTFSGPNGTGTGTFQANRVTGRSMRGDCAYTLTLTKRRAR
jgi:hypothetical protein